jgi:Fe-S-cluster-containing hydrogenase component 2
VDMMHEVYTCQQCEDHPCYDACPPKIRAMQIDESGIVYIDQEKCVGCKSCIKACPFERKRINYNYEIKKAQKCDLCRDRPEGPACIADCQVACLQLSDQPIPEAPPWMPPGA